MNILAFDSSGDGSTAAVLAGGAVRAHGARPGAQGHAMHLLPLIDAVMREAELAFTALDAIAVTLGPGSFTGVRIGLAAARGIALAAGVPVHGVSAFEAAAAALPAAPGRRIVVVLESRRTELFAQAIGGDGRSKGTPIVAAPAAIAAWLPEAPLTLAGAAAGAVAACLPPGRDADIVTAPIDAVALARLAARRRQAGDPGAGAEPLYLRSPEIGPPRRSAP